MSAGDINGDGFDDVVIGIPNGGNYVYVVFGKASGWAASVTLSTLANGTNGFRLDGEANVNTGSAVGIGDINGDGFDDLIIGAPYSNSFAGYTYVVFGKASWTSPIALSALYSAAGPITGVTYTLSSIAPSVTGHQDEVKMRDGLYSTNDTKTGTNLGSGQWIKADFGSVKNVAKVQLAPSDSGPSYTNGRLIQCSTDNSSWTTLATTSGHATNVTKTYDVDASCRYMRLYYGPTNYVNAGDFWFEQSANNAGFRLDGVSANDFSGTSVSAGDINGDGYDDVIIGAFNANSAAGFTYVVFGKASDWISPIVMNTTNLNGATGGFRLDGITNTNSGRAVSAGDINGDGYDDVIIGAPNSSSVVSVAFGKASGWSASKGVNTLNGTDGISLLVGGQGSSYIGQSATSGDINNDGYDDVIIGSTLSNSNAGYTFGLYGNCGGFSANMNFYTSLSTAYDSICWP